MARNRVIYQSDALYISENPGSTASGKHAQLRRIQSANYNYTINRQDVNQFGQLARIDAIVLDQPTVGVDLTYYLGDGFNEKALGLQVGTNLSGQFGSGHMSSSFTGKNIYILTTDEGVDANNQDAASRAIASGFSGASIIGIGNAYLTNYSVDFAVGAIPTVSATFEGLNIMSQTGIGRTTGSNIGYTGLSSAGVNATAGTKLAITNVELFYAQPGIVSGNTAGSGAPTALRPGDVTITLASGGSGIADAGSTSFPIQSATITHPFAREDIMKLGSRFATAKVVTFPITATVAIKATLTDIQQRNLADILDANNTQDIQIAVRQPGSSTVNSIVYKIAACKLDSESFSSSIGSNKSVDLSFSTQIGGANDTSNGIYVSGACNIDPFNATPNTSGAYSGVAP